MNDITSLPLVVVSQNDFGQVAIKCLGPNCNLAGAVLTSTSIDAIRLVTEHASITGMPHVLGVADPNQLWDLRERTY